jgi:transketolase
MPTKDSSFKNIALKANNIRMSVVEMLGESGTGHIGGSLGLADILATLYFKILNVDPKNPNKPTRDRLVLSNGHVCPALYATLAEAGFIDKRELKNIRKLNSKLEGHPVYGLVPGIENSSGSLGQGLSQAIGMALASKIDKKNYRVYCITGDGELNEGQVWEAAMFAPNRKITNLTWIIDRNNIQIDGNTEKIMPLENLRDKLESFNWYVIEINGNEVEEIVKACDTSKSVRQRPVAIIANTVPGKGVSFMEYKFSWHGKVPKKDEVLKALLELKSLEGIIKKL